VDVNALMERILQLEARLNQQPVAKPADEMWHELQRINDAGLGEFPASAAAASAASTAAGGWSDWTDLAPALAPSAAAIGPAAPPVPSENWSALVSEESSDDKVLVVRHTGPARTRGGPPRSRGGQFAGRAPVTGIKREKSGDSSCSDCGGGAGSNSD
jgi:hypothetical protein